MNSLWLIVTALAAFAVAYRLYGAFLAARVAMLDDARITPAHRLEDGVDYHPTNKLVLFGVHFAAIAGPGPLIGPVLAAQWGWFPGFSWIIIGACLAGGVHDFVTLWASVREDGLSLPQIARRNIGPLAGIVTSIATMFILIAVLASVAIVVVNALAESSWGLFTILATIPAALVTGLWMYKVRPGKIGEASILGVVLVLAGVILGRPFAESAWGQALLLDRKALSLILPAYSFVAAALPVWVLMCPRDYLSSYMKIGVMAVLGVGIMIAAPHLHMPATTPFLHGGGPVVKGAVWPFVCIVIMCGALSGFHALIASGTTPKMVNKERDVRVIGYGAMVLEGFVAVTALVAACALQPGDYFAINISQNTPAQVAAYHHFTETTVAEHNWDVKPHELTELERETGEVPRVEPDGTTVGGLRGRVGGAVTLAVGMAKVFASLPGMKQLVAYWYHFVIMFEALFILTLLETGTRVARFVFQETVDQIRGAPAGTGKANWVMNIGLSAATCFMWGYLLYTGNLDTLWRMLGIANQLLATIALAVGTTYLLNHAPRRWHALLTGVPLAFTVVTVGTAGVQSVAGWWAEAAAPGLPASQVFQLHLLCVLASTVLILTGVIMLDAARKWISILSKPVDEPVVETA